LDQNKATSQDRQSPTNLEYALQYRQLGFSIVPMEPQVKRGAIEWAPLQRRRPAEKTLRCWWGQNPEYGIAVIAGEISGNLIARDFDVADSYQEWATRFPDFAKVLPTVVTSRGFHVYCRGDLDQIWKATPAGGLTIVFDDGELRGSGLCVLPPTLHKSGHVYRWLADFPTSFPKVDLVAAGFLSPDWTQRTQRDTAYTRGHRRTQRNQEVGLNSEN
jgi:hypothetical protein